MVRDHCGIKPLYYYWNGRQLAWASELKALIKFSSVPKEIDNTGLYDYFTYSYIPTPKSIYKNIFKLQPGHYATISLDINEIEMKCWWSLNYSPKDISFSEASDTIASTLIDSVGKQLVSDRALGFFLSGGIDSTAIVGAAKALQISEIKAYTVEFSNKQYSDEMAAKEIANHLNVDISTTLFDQDRIEEFAECLSSWHDEPFSNLSSLPTYILCKYASQYVTVALSGDGGDELFGGYSRYNRYFSKLGGSAFHSKFSRPVLLSASRGVRRGLTNKVRKLGSGPIK